MKLCSPPQNVLSFPYEKNLNLDECNFNSKWTCPKEKVRKHKKNKYNPEIYF